MADEALATPKGRLKVRAEALMPTSGQAPQARLRPARLPRKPSQEVAKRRLPSEIERPPAPAFAPPRAPALLPTSPSCARLAPRPRPSPRPRPVHCVPGTAARACGGRTPRLAADAPRPSPGDAPRDAPACVPFCCPAGCGDPWTCPMCALGRAPGLALKPRE